MQIKLKEFFYISNILSISRIILIIPIIYILSLEKPEYNFLIIIISLCAALTDFLDGYFSRKLNLITDLGIVLDPIADKIAMAALLIALVHYRDFPIMLLLFLVYRDLLILIIGWFVNRKNKKPVMANFWGKLNTTLIAFFIIIFLFEVKNLFYTFVLYMSYLSIAVSGISYAIIGENILFSKGWMKYLYRVILLLTTILFVCFVLQIDK